MADFLKEWCEALGFAPESNGSIAQYWIPVDTGKWGLPDSPQATPAPVVGSTEAGTTKEPCVGCGQTACTGKYGACRIRIATPQVTMKTYSLALEDVVGVLNKMVNSIEPDQTLSRLDWVTPEHDLTPSPRAVLMVDDQSEPP